MKYPEAGVNLCEKQLGFAFGDEYWQTKKNKSKIVIWISVRWFLNGLDAWRKHPNHSIAQNELN